MFNLVVTIFFFFFFDMAILNLPVLQVWLPYFNLEVMIGILKKKCHYPAGSCMCTTVIMQRMTGKSKVNF